MSDFFLYNIIKWFVGQFGVKFEKKPEREARWFFREYAEKQISDKRNR